MARSPNYPNHDLRAALALAKDIYDKDGRNKVSRETLAVHLGHESLSGPALGKIGALRAYGLLDGTGDELRISDDCLAALRAPEGSPERNAALVRLAGKPALFQSIQKHFTGRPSKENLVFWLEKQNFMGNAAEIAAKSYLQTMLFVDSLDGGGDKSALEEGAPTSSGGDAVTHAPANNRQFKMAEGERELTTGILAKDASFRLVVRGRVGVKEIERLIQKLEVDKEILAEEASAELPETE